MVLLIGGSVVRLVESVDLLINNVFIVFCHCCTRKKPRDRGDAMVEEGGSTEEGRSTDSASFENEAGPAETHEMLAVSH